MDRERYRFIVGADDRAAANTAAQALADALLVSDGVVAVDREKIDQDTMDVGTIVTALAGSGATLAIAKGIAEWLRSRRGVTLTYERRRGTESVKVAVSGIDPQIALRITEVVRSGKDAAE